MSFAGKVNVSVLYLQLLTQMCDFRRDTGGETALCGSVCYETVDLLLMPQVIFNLKRSNSVSPMRRVRDSSRLPGNSMLLKSQNRKQNWHLLIQFLLLTTLITVPRDFFFYKVFEICAGCAYTYCQAGLRAKIRQSLRNPPCQFPIHCQWSRSRTFLLMKSQIRGLCLWLFSCTLFMLKKNE